MDNNQVINGLRQLKRIVFSENSFSGILPYKESGFGDRILKIYFPECNEGPFRSIKTIERYVNWIHRCVLDQKSSSILDLCCGPGLYGWFWAKLNHRYIGIDYSPSFIKLAQLHAEQNNLGIKYILGDVKELNLQENFDLITFLWGDCNYFNPDEIKLIFNKLLTLLKPNGKIIIEFHTYLSVKKEGLKESRWWIKDSGFMFETAHLLLSEHHWNPKVKISKEKFYAIEIETNEVRKICNTLYYYHRSTFSSLLIF